MRLNLAFALVLFGVGLTLPALALSPVLAASPMQLEVSSFRVRQGETVTLSGSLFQPHVPLQIQMSCPPLFGGRGATTRPGRGPVTDSHGNFKGFRFRTVKQATNRTLQCSFMADECPPCGTPAKAGFTLLPPAQKRELFTLSFVPSHPHVGQTLTVKLTATVPRYCGVRIASIDTAGRSHPVVWSGNFRAPRLSVELTVRYKLRRAWSRAEITGWCWRRSSTDVVTVQRGFHVEP